MTTAYRSPFGVLAQHAFSFIQCLQRSACVLIVLLSATGVRAQPAGSYEVHPDYTVRHWTTADGLPVNGGNHLLKTQDGYLWISSRDGLTRFGGGQFTVFNTFNTPELGSNRTYQLHESADGYLWIEVRPQSIVRYRDGQFERLDRSATPFMSFASTGDTLWMPVANGLAMYRNGVELLFRPDVINAPAQFLLRDRQGHVWVNMPSKGIGRINQEGEVTWVALEDIVPRRSFHTAWEDWEEGIWIAGSHTFRIVGEQVKHDNAGQGSIMDYYRQREEMPMPSNVLRSYGGAVQAPDSSIWRYLSSWSGPNHQADERWGRVYQDAVQIFEVQDSRITSIELDGDGGLWVLTQRGGLFHVQRRSLVTYSVPEGIPAGSVYPVIQARDSTVWIGTVGGIATLRGEQVGKVFPSRRFRRDGRSASVLSLYEDRAGQIWVSTWTGMCIIRGDICEPWSVPLDTDLGVVRAMFEDDQERLWMGAARGIALRSGELGAYTWKWFGFEGGQNQQARVIRQTRDGIILIGTNGGGLISYGDDNGFETLTTDSDGGALPSNEIRDIYEDEDGFAWLALEDRGLCRLDWQDQRTLAGAALACLTTKDGLYDNSLHRILEDNDGRFWINTNRGIFWVQRDELNAYIAGERLLLTSVAYTEADGMRNQEGNGGVQSAGTRTADGKLWFPTLDGVVVIDPAQVPLPMPQAVIESVRVEDVVRPLGNALVLTAKERDMSFALLGVEPNQPEDVHLQYRLVGYDETWHAAGAQWVATYTNLEPGTYQFEARAGLGGVWSVPVVKPFDRRALFWETGWFYGLCGVLLAGLVYGGYRYRVRQLEAGQRRLEATVASRTSEIEAQKAQITEQARKLKQANALKSRFLANISHEFRTPLTLTFGPLDDALAGQYGRLPERARPHFERARQNGWRLLRLINQLLDLSRLDAGMNGLQAHRHDLVAFVRQRMAAFESLAAMHSVKLRMETEAPSIPHVFDAEKLETVVLNLLSNAIKFVNEGGAVTVHVAREAEAAVIRVHNTGSFIPLEAQPHLFDRFYQVDGSATRRRDGSGIGLSLVHELVKLHGGEIAVASSADSGTAFTVTLPALPHDEATAWVRGDGRSEQVAVELALPSRDVIEAMPEASAAVEEALPAPPTDGTRPVVLIVEDNADMRAYLRDHLATTYHVEEAEDGVAGLDVAREVVPDLVLSDVMMPRMDGFGLVAALKTDVQTSHIPVVLLTAKGEVDSKIEGLEAGADDYLTKPFNASELRARVANLIAQRRMLRTRYQAEVQAGPPSAVVGLPAPDVAFLEQVEATVQAHLADELFGVEVLAEAVAMSPRQLRRKLKGVLGETPNQLIVRHRLTQAATLLEQPDVRVGEVATAIGFRSTSRFREAFRAQYDMSPSQYAARASTSA